MITDMNAPERVVFRPDIQAENFESIYNDSAFARIVGKNRAAADGVKR